MTEIPQKMGYGLNEVLRVQKRLFEMAVIIKEILESNHIPYMLAYGSLLGAVRHKGFIPWDDDLDFNLFDDSYDDAIAALKRDVPEGMFVEDSESEPRYFHGWAHIKDLHTRAYCGRWAHDNSYAHKGIHIDLYRIKRMFGRDASTYLQNENLRYLERRRSKGLITEWEYANRIAAARTRDLTPIEYMDVEGYSMINIYKCKFVPMDVILPLSSCVFNDVVFAAPHSPSQMLKMIYGDYMRLPKYENRLPSFDKVEFC